MISSDKSKIVLGTIRSAIKKLGRILKDYWHKQIVTADIQTLTLL